MVLIFLMTGYPTSHFFICLSVHGRIGVASHQMHPACCLANKLSARSGSKHLDFLQKNQLIELSRSKILDEIYTLQKLTRSLETLKSDFKAIQSPTRNEVIPFESPETPSETMLLSPSSGRLIAECLEIPAIEQEVERAIRQVETSLRAERELEREKARLSAATDQSTTQRIKAE